LAWGWKGKASTRGIRTRRRTEGFAWASRHLSFQFPAERSTKAAATTTTLPRLSQQQQQQSANSFELSLLWCGFMTSSHLPLKFGVCFGRPAAAAAWGVLSF